MSTGYQIKDQSASGRVFIFECKELCRIRTDAKNVELLTTKWKTV
jgi:nitrogen regulatory protein PII